MRLEPRVHGATHRALDPRPDQDLRRRHRSALASSTSRSPPGEFFGLLGPNGAGKTTLINAVCNLIRMSGGRDRTSSATTTPRWRRGGVVGVAEQDPNLDRFLTVRESLVYHGGYFGMTGTDARARAPTR